NTGRVLCAFLLLTTSEYVMKRSWPRYAACALMLALYAGALGRGADAPYVGNWKVTDVTSGKEQVFALVQIEEKDGKAEAKLLAAPLLGKDAKVENFKIDAKSMQFDVKIFTSTFNVKAYFPTAGAKNTDVLGSFSSGTRTWRAHFAKT